MSVTVTYKAQAKVVETLPNNTGSAADTQRKITHENYDESLTLDANSTPPCTLLAAFLATLSGGALTIDLTALTGTNGASVSLSGLQPQVVRVKNLGANSLTVSTGASNGHNAFTADGVVIPPGGHAQFMFNDGTENVDGTHKTWDLAGTGSQTSEWTIIGG